jgi:hypothetical protein
MSKEPKGRPGHGSASGNPLVTRPDVPSATASDLSQRIVELAQGAQLQAQAPVSRVKM